MKSLASDNYSSAHKDIISFISEINDGHQVAYGDDKYTAEAKKLIKKEFGCDDLFFVYNGTAANTLSLSFLTRPINSIICSDIAHIMTHEVTAPQSSSGCKFIAIKNSEGKITANEIKDEVEKELYWGRHSTIPKVVSITQPTEVGTIYSLEELKSISNICKEYDMFFHIDGCRIYNAAVSLKKDLKEITKDCGVDILSMGGTKNGLMFGEAVLFFEKNMSKDFEYYQKQKLQLQSKTRYLSAQFIPFFKNKIWHENACNANLMTNYLKSGLEQIGFNKFTYDVETNQIFMTFPLDLHARISEKVPFYVYDIKKEIVRFVTSFDTTKSDIDYFLNLIE